jgi:Restriction endonuclease/GYF domain 2
VNTHKTTCYECGGEVNPIAKTCPSCGAPLPFGPQLPANFHVARQRKRFGPYTEVAARNSLAQGTIRPDDLCWQPGMATWLPVSRVLQPRPTARPQPIDYGLTYDDLNLYSDVPWTKVWRSRLKDGKVITCIGTRPDDTYKQGRRWFASLLCWSGHMEALLGLGFYALLFGAFMIWGKQTRVIGLCLLAFGSVCVLPTIIPGMIITRLRKRASPALEKYWQALHAYDDNKAAAEEAARKAARDAELRKRSYWAFLDGYAFERATAEVLRKHQFTAMVTPGSADGGVDIEVTRNGLKGVVQCKAHVACVGPHVVRDLYGVIHHCEANFGIIVSRGGFTRGAHDFRRDKPILFLDTDDLIAMQEGRDVLAAAFAPRDANTASQQQ